MKKRLIKHLVLSAIAVSAFGIAGCNIFNPTESVNIASDDAKALTYEGYLHYQKSEYTLAREYFEKAINADSAYSEAWYGRSKAVLNMQPGLNIFELISYAKAEEGQNAVSKFMSMPNEQASLLKSGIDSVMISLDPFIERDSTNRTDKRVRFADFASSYSVLQLTKLALTVRTANVDVQNLFVSNGSSMSVNWSELSGIGEDTKEAFDALSATATALKSNPEATKTILKEYVPGSEMLSDTGLTVATEFMANQIINMNEKIQNSAVDRSDVYLLVGNVRDDDGDGCIDEEIPDGFDNDGDGEVDEDLRHHNTIVPETDFVHHNVSKPSQYIKAVKVTDTYKTLDLDMNGIDATNDSEEWEFVLDNSNERDAQGNHLFKFAYNISWSTDFVNANLDDRIAIKELIRKDNDINNIKYPLEMRKAMLGGCWNNYTEEQFLKWFPAAEEN